MNEPVPEEVEDNTAAARGSLPAQTPSLTDVKNQDACIRRLDHDVRITEAMGGPLVEQDERNLEMIYDVLDLACGSGGWGLQVASAFPEMEVTGIDISPSAIRSANTFAKIQHLTNARFLRRDVTPPLPFPDSSFDLVNARFMSEILLPQHWPLLLNECFRLLRPGGIVRLTEGEWGIVTPSAPAVARLFNIGLDARYKAGRSFLPDGRYQSIAPLLLQFIRVAGFQEAACKAYALDHSYGSALYSSFIEDQVKWFKIDQSFILKQQIATDEELEDLYKQALLEMRSEHFGALLYLFTVWGKRPQ
jgi:ubiquinone/menaquinone biosynthesis C-methylase UbiE